MGTRFVQAVFVVAVCWTTAVGVAAAAGPANIYDGGDVHEGIGQDAVRPLQRGAVYGANTFPFALRVRPTDGRWDAGQFQSGRFRFVQLGHLRTGDAPLHGVGFITLEAAAGSTPTTTATIKRLHATPHIKAGPIKAARVAGFAGETFDAAIVGTDRPPVCKRVRCERGVSFAPFTTNLHCGFCNNTMKGETQDVKFAKTGQLFRIIVLDVRGKTAVIYLESTYADQPKFSPAKIFPTFLPYAQQMLSSLSFPR